MAQVPIPFDAEAFREGILLAMSIGLPPDEEDQPLFVFPPSSTAEVPIDENGVPFDPEAEATVTPGKTVRVPCAVEYQDGQGKVVNFGVQVPSKAVITFLDAEYQQVKGFQYVVLGGSRYFYSHHEPPLGMVSVGVWTVHCVSEDQI